MVESLEEKYGDTSNIVENILEENQKITPESPGYEVSRQRVADTEAKTQQLITNFREGFLSGTVKGADGEEIPMAQAFGTLSDDALFDYAENYFPGGVDIEGMRNAGYSNEEIMSFLYGTSPKSYTEALATEGTRGTTEGVTTGSCYIRSMGSYNCSNMDDGYYNNGISCRNVVRKRFYRTYVRRKTYLLPRIWSRSRSFLYRRACVCRGNFALQPQQT